MATIHDLHTIGTDLKKNAPEQKNRRAGSRLIMMIDSHNYEHDQDAIILWDQMFNHTEAFFHADLMPKTWKANRSFSEAVKAMLTPLQMSAVKAHIVASWGEDGYQDTLTKCDRLYKQYENNYTQTRPKKTTTSSTPSETASVSSDDENEVSQPRPPTIIHLDTPKATTETLQPSHTRHILSNMEFIITGFVSIEPSQEKQLFYQLLLREIDGLRKLI